MWAAQDTFQSYVSLEDIRDVTQKLKPLVDLMKEQSLLKVYSL